MFEKVSIHTLHELEASIFLPTVGTKFCQRVSIHTLHELEASINPIDGIDPGNYKFPFIRFTNWKQDILERDDIILNLVSIHTLHELEARITLFQVL